MLVDFTMLASQENRARVALRLMNDDDKKGQASRFVANLKHEYGYGSATMCLVYNATGSTLHHQPTTDNQLSSGGSLYREEYPKEIRNGQWAAFLHVHTTKGTTGSVAAAVYRARNSKGQERDILLAWYTEPLSPKQHNKVNMSC
ncbi:hypothetical protein U9M48_038037 [Paspalum notatum var. saurae]|uniref:Jasmonate-induced protein n=1 Tax=Paspalum notatum var. saurae TaxID=547442 RepID=A0AAQ3X9Y3_PASNO